MLHQSAGFPSGRAAQTNHRPRLILLSRKIIEQPSNRVGMRAARPDLTALTRNHGTRQPCTSSYAYPTNALFVESDCTSCCGKVAQPTTSIGEMACLVNIGPRPTGTLCRSEANFYAESLAPSLPITSKWPVTRPGVIRNDPPLDLSVSDSAEFAPTECLRDIA
jgi:hypothetical protein